jgi:hypothetical protein
VRGAARRRNLQKVTQNPWWGAPNDAEGPISAHREGQLSDLYSNPSERFPDEKNANRDAAQYLWGYNYWNRIVRLRGLTGWAREQGLTDQVALRRWAQTSQYRSDFEGQIKGLGISAYCWLVMRLGVDTVKPDSRRDHCHAGGSSYLYKANLVLGVALFPS